MSRIKLSSQEYIPEILKLAMTTAKLSNEILPTHNYSDPATEELTRTVQSKLEDLLSTLVRFVTPNTQSLEYDEIVEAADKCLENIAIQIDSKDSSSPSNAQVLSHLSLYELPKPQNELFGSIDNSDSLFVPKLAAKANAKYPLELHCDEIGYLHPYQNEIAELYISPEQLQAAAEPFVLPLDSTPLVYVSTPELFHLFLREISNEREIAVDLEHHSTRSYQGILCLMQVSTRTKDYIIDLFSVWSEMPLLLDVLTNPSITKVFHGAESDVGWLQRDFGLYIVNMFDTGQASRALLYPRFSLAYLLEHICGVYSDKRYQRADWRVRPLTEEHMLYARLDTHYLLYIYDVLRHQLIQQARELHKQPYECIIGVIQKSKEVCLKRYSKPQLKYSGLRGGTELLNEDQHSALEGILDWRDQLARQLDENPNFILGGRSVLGLAMNPPSTVQELMHKLSQKNDIIKENAGELLEVIQSALSGAVVVGGQIEKIVQEVKGIRIYGNTEEVPVVNVHLVLPPRVTAYSHSLVHGEFQRNLYQQVLGKLSGFMEENFSLMKVEELCVEQPRQIQVFREDGEIEEDLIPLSLKEKYSVKRRKRLPHNHKVQISPQKKQKVSEHKFTRIGWLDDIELAPAKRKNLSHKKRK